jgi:hypothetical protein
MTEPTNDAPCAVRQHTMEFVVALLAFGFGAIVMADSWRIGAGWADDGPQAGYFPFYIGLIICGSSAWTAMKTWRARHRAERARPDHGDRDRVYLTRPQLRRILALLLPLVVYLVAIRPLGIYVASAIFIGYFMARHGAHRRWITAVTALGVPAVLFVMFEIWFRTPLPKGPLEALLGFQ